MPLTKAAPVTFIPTQKPEAARTFYEATLGLRFVHDDGFALVFSLGAANTMLRVIRAGAFTPEPFTILGWEVNDLPTTLTELATKNVAIQRYPSLEQDAQGIWTAPTGDRIAWFKDPDGNTLSLSQHQRCDGPKRAFPAQKGMGA